MHACITLTLRLPDLVIFKCKGCSVHTNVTTEQIMDGAFNAIILVASETDYGA